MKVSVIIPAHNAETYIGQCLRTLEAQTLSDFHIIVVDDGSTDGTMALLRGEETRTAAPRLTIVTQQHQGVSAARNTGLSHAVGEYIAFVDADDYLHPQYLELMVQALEQHPEASFVLTPSVKTTHGDDASMRTRYQANESTVIDRESMCRQLFLGAPTLSHEQWHTCHGKLFRRDAIGTLSFATDLTICEDALFVYQVCLRSKEAVLLSQRLYFWRQHRGSLLHSGLTPERMRSIDAYVRCLRLTPREDIAARGACLRRIATHGAWLLYLSEEQPHYQKARRDIRRVLRQTRPQMLTNKHISLKNRWQLLLLTISRKARHHTFHKEKRQDVRSIQDSPSVGKAPREQSGLVSVIVPIYNIIRWLPACVGSIRRQRYQHIEIILVDDGSTDGCAELCDQYAKEDPRIRVVHQPNGGLSAARNSGLAIATGEYILMPDGDDILHPLLIYLAHEALQQGDFPFAMVGRRQGRGDKEQETEGVRLRLLTQQDLMAGLTNRTERGVDCHVAWNKLYRRDAIGNLRFEDTAAEDTLFNARLFLTVPYAITVEAPLYYWRQREGSLSHDRESPKSIDRLLSLLQCMRLMPRGSNYRRWFRQYLHHCLQSEWQRSHPLWLYPRLLVTTARILWHLSFSTSP